MRRRKSPLEIAAAPIPSGRERGDAGEFGKARPQDPADRAGLAPLADEPEDLGHREHRDEVDEDQDAVAGERFELGRIQESPPHQPRHQARGQGQVGHGSDRGLADGQGEREGRQRQGDGQRPRLARAPVPEAQAMPTARNIATSNGRR